MKYGWILLIAALWALNVPACSDSAMEDRQKERELLATLVPDQLRLAHQVGGSHRGMVMHDGRWYQCFGRVLAVINQKTLLADSRVDLAEPGELGPACDVAVAGDRMYVVMEDDAVVELEMANPQRPTVERVKPAFELGIRPRTLSVVNDELYVCGGGGVVRWSDGRRFLTDAEEVTSVVKADAGLVATTGRRVLELESGSYVGAASRLWPIADPTQAGGAALLFALQASSGATVGLMNPAIREIDARTVNGRVRNVRFFNGRVWVATDRQAMSFGVADGRLVDPQSITALGIRDFGMLAPNRVALAGDGGRAVYRPTAEATFAGDTFVRSHREPGHLIAAMSDGRRIIAGAPEATWVYLVGSSVELATKPIDRTETPIRDMIAIDVKVKITDDSSAVEFGEGETMQVLAAPGASRHECMVFVEEDVFVGHDRGITVFRRDAAGVWQVLDSLRLEGPIRFLFAERLARGVAYVSEYGGMGVVRFETPEVPVTDKEKRAGPE